MPFVFVVFIYIVVLPHESTTSRLSCSRLSANTKLGSRSCISSDRNPTLCELLQQMSSHGSERRRASEDPRRSDSWGTDRRGEDQTRPRREASAGSQRTSDWQWEDRSEGQWRSHDEKTESDQSKPLWKNVQPKRGRPEEDAMSVQSEPKQSWSRRGHHPTEFARAEQGCPPREWRDTLRAARSKRENRPRCTLRRRSGPARRGKAGRRPHGTGSRPHGHGTTRARRANMIPVGNGRDLGLTVGPGQLRRRGRLRRSPLQRKLDSMLMSKKSWRTWKCQR